MQMSGMRNSYSILFGNLERKCHMGDLSIGGGIISKWILEKQVMKAGTGFVCFRLMSSGAFCEYGNLKSLKARNFFTR